MKVLPKDPASDPEDARRVDDIERNFQAKTRKFTARPAVKQLSDLQFYILNDGNTVTIGFRLDNKEYEITATEVT